MTTSIAPRRREHHDPIAWSLARDRLGVRPVVFMVIAAAAPMTVIAGGATAGWAVTGVKGIPMAYLAMALVLAIFWALFALSGVPTWFPDFVETPMVQLPGLGR